MKLFRRRALLQVDRLITDSRDGVDFRFTVDSSTEKEPNTARIEVWNLATKNREALERKKDVTVRLEVGYEEADTFELFRGVLRYAETKQEGPDRVTALESGDGERSYRGARISKSFRRGERTNQVVSEIANALGVSEGNLREAVKGRLMGGNTDTYEHGVVLDGSASDEMDRVMRSLGLEWSIQGGRLQVTERGKGILGKPVLLTSRFEGRPAVNEDGLLVFEGAGDNTGLLGAPSVDGDGVVSARALIMPGLSPGMRVKVQSLAFDSVGVVKEATYSGSTFGQEWVVDLRLEPERA